MLGLLLARAGVDVLVLEKHKDFLRDFRGDTVHPSTLEVLWELGLLERFLQRPHQKLSEVRGHVGSHEIVVADFSRLHTHCRFVAMMPQWDFLSFLCDEAARFPGFRLLMQAEVTGITERAGRVTGVVVRTAEGPLEVAADLVVGADGRSSTVRAAAALDVEDLGAPIDVLWLRLPRDAHHDAGALGYFTRGHVFVMLDRGDYWQCAFVIRKAELESIKARGIETFKAEIVQLVPALRDSVQALGSWDDVKLLTVKVDRLRRWWRPGLLCIGDCAHAMSPIGGVGINLAVQDAVAAANLLAAPLRARSLANEHLANVERRRVFPTRVTQAFQVAVQDHVIGRVLEAKGSIEPPWPLRLLERWPALRRIPARAIGIGVRPEHVSESIRRAGAGVLNAR